MIWQWRILIAVGAAAALGFWFYVLGADSERAKQLRKDLGFREKVAEETQAVEGMTDADRRKELEKGARE